MLPGQGHVFLRVSACATRTFRRRAADTVAPRSRSDLLLYGVVYLLLHPSHSEHDTARRVSVLKTSSPALCLPFLLSLYQVSLVMNLLSSPPRCLRELKMCPRDGGDQMLRAHIY